MRPQQTAQLESKWDARPPGASANELVGPFEITLAAALDAPAAARAAVCAWMSGHVSETMLADAQLLVVELVANSVRHGDAPAGAVVRVRARVGLDVIHLEVEDGGTAGSVTRRSPDLEHGGGFGLQVVEALSRRWGVSRDAGTRVWAELAFPATG
jgi:anti-sigma regulatory factor (Ser/Thr protein kinase)